MKKNGNSNFYPVLINLKRFPCLVIGGGKVAYRKALSLLEFNAEVTVLSPKICRSLMDLHLQNKIHIIKKAYSKNYIRNYKIIFSATDNPEVNKIVNADCMEAGILLNVSDNPSLCDFILPANIKRGDLTISVSSQGKAPFYTKEMKRKIDGFIPTIYSDIIDLAGNFRKQLLNSSPPKSGKTKERLFKKFIAINWEKILAENGKRDSEFFIQKILK